MTARATLTTEDLHHFAREHAEGMAGINRKLVRWNEIVHVAETFYPRNPLAGVIECLRSCSPGDPMYDGKNTLAASLAANYRWML